MIDTTPVYDSWEGLEIVTLLHNSKRTAPLSRSTCMGQNYWPSKLVVQCTTNSVGPLVPSLHPRFQKTQVEFIQFIHCAGLHPQPLCEINSWTGCETSRLKGSFRGLKTLHPSSFFWGKELVGNLNTLTAKVTWIFTTYFNFYSCLKLTCFGHTQTACTFARSLRIHRSSRIVAAMALPMQPVVPPQPVVLAAPGSPQSSQAGSVTRDT